jgi:hypothetical protein
MNSKKKHIVIIAQKFPPHSNVGGRRPYFFSKYLSELGYKVSVITGNYPIKKNMTWVTDLSFLKIIKLDFTALATKKKGNQIFFYFLYEFLKHSRYSILNRISWKIGEFFLPLDFNDRLDFNEYDLANKIGKIDYIIATGGPWSMFEYGVRLKSVTNAKLILDYRDPWNDIIGVGLNELTYYGLFNNYIKRRKLKEEKYVLLNSDFVISVSKEIINNILKISNFKKIGLIENGYDLNEFKLKKTNSLNYEILYFGILRKEQSIELLLKALKIINNPKIILNLIGVNISQKHVLNKINAYRKFIKIKCTNYVNKNIVSNYISSASLLVHFSYGNIKGIPSSKLYQYLSLNKPILLVSNTNNIMEKIIRETNTGEICKTPEKIADYILNSYSKWENNQTLERKVNKEKLAFYSFKNQVDLLDKIISDL